MKCDAAQFEQISKDSAYHDVGTLPSQGHPYKGRMDKLFIRPFRLNEMRLLSKSAQLNDLDPLIRAVDLCISHDVYDLTIGDFYYVLLWLRIYSMPDSPYILEWYCNQPYFTHKETNKALLYTEENWPNAEMLTKDYDVESCDTHNTSVVQIPTIDVLCLDEEFELDPDLDYPRVNILVNLNASLLDADLCMLAPAIQWLQGSTWAEKIATAESDRGMNLIAKALKINREVVHGINETVTFNCRKCRVEHTQTLKLNALTFFQ
jgi:hypothetical protein